MPGGPAVAKMLPKVDAPLVSTMIDFGIPRGYSTAPARHWLSVALSA